MSAPSYFVHRPGDHLRSFVREILFLDSEKPRSQVLMPETTFTLTLQPSGTSSIGGSKLAVASFSGLQSGSRTVQVSAGSAMVIVRFTEVGAKALIDESLAAFYDQSLPADDILLRREVDEILNGLIDSKTNGERTGLVESFLARRARPRFWPKSEIEVAAGLIRRTGGRVSVDKLTRLLQTSHSTLERRFKDAVGATPKALARLARLQNVCRLWGHGMSLTDIAYEAGFSDQAHLNHDFKNLVGAAPEEFFARPSPRNLPTFYK